MRQTQRPERTRSLACGNLELGHIDFAAQVLADLLGRCRLEEPRKRFNHVYARLRHASSLAGHIDFRAKRNIAFAFRFDDRRQLPVHPVPPEARFAGVGILQEPSEEPNSELPSPGSGSGLVLLLLQVVVAEETWIPGLEFHPGNAIGLAAPGPNNRQHENEVPLFQSSGDLNRSISGNSPETLFSRMRSGGCVPATLPSFGPPLRAPLLRCKRRFSPDILFPDGIKDYGRIRIRDCRSRGFQDNMHRQSPVNGLWGTVRSREEGSRCLHWKRPASFRSSTATTSAYSSSAALPFGVRP